MSRKTSENQEAFMRRMFLGRNIWKQLNTGRIDEHVSAVREYIANIFFYTKNGKTIMIDAGYNYPRLAEKMGWLGIDPAQIQEILITHIDTDHVGALEPDAGGLFRDAKLYLGRIENRYLTGEARRKVCHNLFPLPQPVIENERELLEDGQVLEIGGIRVECFLMPGHTRGHMVYLIDDRYLFMGDTVWFGLDGGYSFLTTLAWSNREAVASLARLKERLEERKLHPVFITGHTGWSADFKYVFAKTDKCCGPFARWPEDPQAPYDGYDESGDTEEGARSGWLQRKLTAADLQKK